MKFFKLFWFALCSAVSCQTFNSFRPLTDFDGQSLCAVDAANETKSVDELAVMYTDVVPSSAPPQVHCAWRCTNHEPCLGFNYRLAGNTSSDCQFYYQTPTLYQQQGNCAFSINTDEAGGEPLNGTTASGIPSRTLIVVPGRPFALPILTVNNWILVQNKVVNGSVSFNRTWTDYRAGFGSPFTYDNYWIGLENIFRLTSATNYKLRVEIRKSYNTTWLFAEYSSFSINSEMNLYRLNVTGYSGTAGGALDKTAKQTWAANNMSFSTIDGDNDAVPTSSCALERGGGWWYNHCSTSYVNVDTKGCWSASNDTTPSVEFSRMLIARQSY